MQQLAGLRIPGSTHYTRDYGGMDRIVVWIFCAGRAKFCAAAPNVPPVNEGRAILPRRGYTVNYRTRKCRDGPGPAP